MSRVADGIVTAASLAEHARSYVHRLESERSDPDDSREHRLAQDQGVALRSVIAYSAASITEALCAVAEAVVRR